MPHRRDSPLVKAIIGARDEVASFVDEETTLEEVLESCCHGGKFRVSDAYDMIREHGEEMDWFRIVWDTGNTPKHCFILWMAILGRLSTRDRLHFLDIDPTCHWCGLESESHDHLFFGCTYAREVWRQVCYGFRMSTETTSRTEVIAYLLHFAPGRSWTSRARIYAFSATIYYLWHSRNALVFDRNSIPIDILVRMIRGHTYRLLYEAFPARVGERFEV